MGPGSEGRRAPRLDLLGEVLVGIAPDGGPIARRRGGPYSASGLTAAATLAGSVHGVVVQTTSDSPVASVQREAHLERGMLELLVVLLAGLLVLRERRAAAGAPLGGAVALVQPAAAVHLLEEAPDVLDVRVREGEVVVAPVHPHAEPLRLIRHHAGVVRDAFPALRSELGQAVGLDLAFGIQSERLLDLDLDGGPGSRSRSGTASRTRVAPCSAGRRPSAPGPGGGRPSGCWP